MCTSRRTLYKKHGWCGTKGWYFTPINNNKKSDLCVWQIAEVSEKPGSNQIINDHKNDKLLLLEMHQEHEGYTGYKLYIISGHTRVLGEWGNDIFTFHALNNNDNTVSKEKMVSGDIILKQPWEGKYNVV